MANNNEVKGLPPTGTGEGVSLDKGDQATPPTKGASAPTDAAAAVIDGDEDRSAPSTPARRASRSRGRGERKIKGSVFVNGEHFTPGMEDELAKTEGVDFDRLRELDVIEGFEDVGDDEGEDDERPATASRTSGGASTPARPAAKRSAAKRAAGKRSSR